MTDFRSWPKKWNDTSLSDLVVLPEFKQSGALWPMFGMLALGAVLRDPNQPRYTTGFRSDRERSRPDPTHFAIRTHDAILHLGFAGRRAARELLDYPVPIIRVDGLDP